MKKPIFALLAISVFVTAAYAGVEDKVNELIPLMAADKVEDRYAPQIEFQSMCANAARPGAEAERAALAKYLVAKAADVSVKQPARVWIVRQLEHIGAAESVSALEGLLKDKDAELREVARRALEKNAAPAATGVLRKALAGGDPTWQVGLIRALGQRRDAEAVPILGAKLSDPGVGSAAAMALGTIGNDAAIKALENALDKKSPGAADGLILAGNQLAAAGKTAPAKAVYEKVFQAGNPAARGAALFGLARVDAAGAEKLILSALTGSDVKLQHAALSAVVEVYQGKLTSQLAAVLPRLTPVVKAQVIRVLDASAEKAVIAATSDGEEVVRVAALETLGRIGTAAAVPALIKAAAGDAQADRQAGEWALVRTAGAGALAAIQQQAAAGEARLRAAAITALASQFDKSALSAMLRYAVETDGVVSKAAFNALRKVGTDSEIEGLAKLAITSKTAGAVEALQAVVGRSIDKAGALKKLIAAAAGADAKGQGAYLEILTGMGGNEAMAEIVKATGNKDEAVRDGAIRALSKWPEFVAVTKLAEIASDPNAKLTHNVLCVQGIIRLVDSCDKEPSQARIDAALHAMRIAKRDDEKKRVLSALASVADKKTVTAFKSLLGDPKFKEDAAMAACALANNLVKPDKRAARDMATAVLDAKISDQATKKAEGVIRKIDNK